MARLLLKAMLATNLLKNGLHINDLASKGLVLALKDLALHLF